MKNVLGILEHLGYREIRPEGSAPKGDSQAGEWAPLSDVNGRLDGVTWTVQAKRRKTVAGYLTCENADVVVTREDRGENLVVLPLGRFLSLLKSAADPLERLLDELDNEAPAPAARSD